MNDDGSWASDTNILPIICNAIYNINEVFLPIRSPNKPLVDAPINIPIRVDEANKPDIYAGNSVTSAWNPFNTKLERPTLNATAAHIGIDNSRTLSILIIYAHKTFIDGEIIYFSSLSIISIL